MVTDSGGEDGIGVTRASLPKKPRYNTGEFTGEVDNQETCKEFAESKIGQTAFKFLHEMKNFLMSTNLHFIEAKHVI